MPAAYLADLAADLLDMALDAVSEARTGVTEPGKVFISVADPIADLGGCCEGSGGTLTVHLGDPQAGAPLLFPQSTQASKAPPCNTTTRARFTITLMRCYPAIDTNQADFAPTAEEFTEQTRQALIDLWCLLTGVREAVRDQDSCGDMRIVGSRQLAPLGGCMAWQLVVEINANAGGPGVGS